MASMSVTVRLSDAAQPFMAAAVDLLQECLEADEALVTDAIKEKAQVFMDVIETRRGEL